jgi:hypothetical protein
MSIDEVSRELGRLAQATEDMQNDLKEHKRDLAAWQEDIGDKIDCLIAKENQRKGMLEAAKSTARVWAGVIGILIAAAIETVRQVFFGG